jgi:hypothetical protein
MIKSIFYSGLFGLTFLSVSATLGAQATLTPEQLLQKARASIGTEAALNGVKSLLIEGTIRQYLYEENDSTKATQSDGTLRIFAQKKSQRRIEIVTDLREEVSVLNNFTGWHYINSKQTTQQTQPEFRNLNAAEILASRIETVEMLNYFLSAEILDGTITDLGIKEWKGQKARVLRVNYDMVYYDRYFDPNTGKLLATETSYGIEIVENGDQVVSGIRFPKTVAYYNKGRLVREDTYTKIQVNAEIKPDSFFNPTGEYMQTGIPKSIVNSSESK